VFGGDEVILHLFGFGFGIGGEFGEAGGDVDLVDFRDDGELGELLFGAGAEGIEGDAGFFEEVGGEPGLLVEEGEEEVFDLELGVGALDRQGLRGTEGVLGFFGEFIEVHM
jgi:hypothetical protein